MTTPAAARWKGAQTKITALGMMEKGLTVEATGPAVSLGGLGQSSGGGAWADRPSICCILLLCRINWRHASSWQHQFRSSFFFFAGGNGGVSPEAMSAMIDERFQVMEQVFIQEMHVSPHAIHSHATADGGPLLRDCV